MLQKLHQQSSVCAPLSFPIPAEDGTSERKAGGGGASGLFITSIPPHTPIKRSTLTSWARSGLSLSGVDMDRFTPHSTRSASTSKVKTIVPLSTIMITAGGRNASTFTHFYEKNIESEGWTVQDLS